MPDSPSVWLNELVEVVAGCMEAHSAPGPVGWRYHQEDDLVDLVVYVTPVELLGGEYDGTIVISGFSLDLHALLAAFERVTDLQWYAHGLGPYDDDGPHISLEGIYQGHGVWLRVLAEPPEEKNPVCNSTPQARHERPSACCSPTFDTPTLSCRQEPASPENASPTSSAACGSGTLGSTPYGVRLEVP